MIAFMSRARGSPDETEEGAGMTKSKARGALTVVGAGFLGIGQITPESRRAIEGADRVFYLVSEVPTVAWLRERNPAAESLHDCYAKGRDRRDSYREMVERILAPARRGLRVCAVFYGHPGVVADPSHEAIRRARAEGMKATMLPGISAEDCLVADLGFDPIDAGLQSYEASHFLLYSPRFDTTAGLLLWQVGALGIIDSGDRPSWNRDAVAILEEVLLESYPADHPVVLYRAATLPVGAPVVRRVALRELAAREISPMATLYVPPFSSRPADLAMARRLGVADL